MVNPLANMFQHSRGPAMGGQQMPSGPMNMIQQFNQFRNNFTGDPKQAVMNLISSGRMSQQQFDQLSQLARTFQNGMRR